MTATPNIDRITKFLAAAPNRKFADDLLDEAKKCLLDWFGVAIAGLTDPTAIAVAALARNWNAQGDAFLLSGGTTAPALAALVNGATGHCLDFDDTHIGSVLHGSGVTWSTVLALGSARARHIQHIEPLLLAAFIAGFETGATIGEAGAGVRGTAAGWHGTAVLGRFCSSAAASVLLRLDQERTRNALGLAATQVGGLVLSFGTMAKPFHAGKSAMDGIMAAELAELGVTGAIDALDNPNAGIFATLFQSPGALPNVQPLGEVWQITRNSFKPYASCQTTHAPADVALRLAPQIEGRPIARTRVFVNPLAIKVAGRVRPATSTEAKFSIAYCVALGLVGSNLLPADFMPARVADAQLQALADRVELVEDHSLDRCQSRIELTFADGSTLTESIDAAAGSLGKPMRWPDLERKFMDLCEPVFGSNAAVLLKTIRHFDQPGSLAQLIHLVQQPRAAAEPVLSSAR